MFSLRRWVDPVPVTYAIGMAEVLEAGAISVGIRDDVRKVSGDGFHTIPLRQRRDARTCAFVPVKIYGKLVIGMAAFEIHVGPATGRRAARAARGPPR